MCAMSFPPKISHNSRNLPKLGWLFKKCACWRKIAWTIKTCLLSVIKTDYLTEINTRYSCCCLHDGFEIMYTCMSGINTYVRKFKNMSEINFGVCLLWSTDVLMLLVNYGIILLCSEIRYLVITVRCSYNYIKTRSGEKWSVSCEFKPWFMFSISHWSTV